MVLYYVLTSFILVDRVRSRNSYCKLNRLRNMFIGKAELCAARKTVGSSAQADAGQQHRLLLGMPLGLDIWERNEDTLIAAASEAQLEDIERRNLAHVERLSTTEDFVTGAQRHTDN